MIFFVIFFSSAFPGIFGTQQETYIQVIKEMLVSCIQPPNADKVCLYEGAIHQFVLILIVSFITKTMLFHL